MMMTRITMLSRVAVRAAGSRMRLHTAAAETQPVWSEVIETSRLEAGDWGEDFCSVKGTNDQVEIVILKKAFDKYDTDGNGVLDRDEIRSALVGLSLDASEQTLDCIFAAYDTNHDGVISLQEWLSGTSPAFHAAVLQSFRDNECRG
eukprot:TRINITY_DN827_c2_g1_i1.p1 TRINITY_DN827_c2_g1~~TRINITY_DN827_c2_g1_i1.p1  ORF type:complete len:147 (+),score=37.84 TRINITY_DN827_c2_g1_i1:68-508(+)